MLLLVFRVLKIRSEGRSYALRTQSAPPEMSLWDESRRGRRDWTADKCFMDRGLDVGDSWIADDEGDDLVGDRSQR